MDGCGTRVEIFGGPAREVVIVVVEVALDRVGPAEAWVEQDRTHSMRAEVQGVQERHPRNGRTAKVQHEFLQAGDIWLPLAREEHGSARLRAEQVCGRVRCQPV